MAEKGGWGEDEGAMSLASGVSESRRPGVESASASIYQESVREKDWNHESFLPSVPSGTRHNKVTAQTSAASLPV